MVHQHELRNFVQQKAKTNLLLVNIIQYLHWSIDRALHVRTLDSCRTKYLPHSLVSSDTLYDNLIVLQNSLHQNNRELSIPLDHYYSLCISETQVLENMHRFLEYPTNIYIHTIVLIRRNYGAHVGTACVNYYTHFLEVCEKLGAYIFSKSAEQFEHLYLVRVSQLKKSMSKI